MEGPRMTTRIPSYRLHKPTGQAVVTLDGLDRYLGNHGTPESRQRYAALIAEWSANGNRMPAPADDLTIVELCAAFWSHAETYYRRPDGSPTTMVHSVRAALAPVKRLYATVAAKDFGPVALRAVRQTWIDARLCRSTINKLTAVVVRMFKWAASREMLPPAAFQALQTVEGLRRGRSDAREPHRVKPVPDAHVEAVRPFVSRQVWALIQLQLFTGARPGELLPMRLADLDVSGKIWLYKVEAHKTAWRGDDRTVYLGPKAQDVLKPFMVGRAITAPLFSPREAEVDRRAASAKGKRRDGQKPNPKATDRVIGDSYTSDSYRRAIERGCEKAWPTPAHLAQAHGESPLAWRTRLTQEQRRQLRDWRREHRWHPHQLRHNAATALRREFGIEAARVILGHSSAATTQIYAEIDNARAVDVIGRVG